MIVSSRAGISLRGSVASEAYSTFLPKPLPPDPPLVLDADIYDLLEKASLALGRLDGMTMRFPNVPLFLYSYIRKEAVLSSQIEGTQSSLSDLLLFETEEMPGVPLDDILEVSRYVAALNHGLQRLQDGFPLSLRLLCEIHEVLLSHGRGRDKTPGEFRRSQNWIGGSRPGNARYVPPPPDRVMECMGALEKFLHNDPVYTPTLLKAALAHVQFETIHPFLDGNGRLGRLLITLLLCAEGVLTEPLLYLSLYFKTNRQEYYGWLQKVREEGDWEGWLRFFLTGVGETATSALQTIKRLFELYEQDAKRINSIGRPAASALRLHQLLQAHPIISIPTAARELSLSEPTVATALKHLQAPELNIVHEVTGNIRHRRFAYTSYLQILNEGTEPLQPGE